ncbi:MAG: S41 family peptidase [Bacteroidota bacterium]
MAYKNSTRSIYLPVMLALALIAGIYLGATLNFGNKPVPQGLSLWPERDFNKINAILNYVEREYVDSVSRKQLVDETVQYMLQELDPHSYYITAEELQALNEPLEGNFDGIGVQFLIQQDTVVVITPVAGGPSEKVGIQPGDRIVEVEGNSIASQGITNRKVMDMLRGERGTEVAVGVKRSGQKDLLDFVITRGEIPINSVDVGYMVDEETGYVKISRFSKRTYEEFLATTEALLQQGMRKLILDLRGNGGGYLEAAKNLVDEFLPANQLIVYTEGRARPRKTYKSTKSSRLLDVELAVLIDEGSASASEIVAGAIQDNDRGWVIGRRSFGKGLVQEQSDWPDGSATRLTIARYYTPTGRCIQKPYDEGIRQYQEDYYNRLQSGELLDADSIDFPDSLKFTTPRGKVVYGGGGIMPDVFVPADTAGSTIYLSKLRYQGLINQYAFEYADKHRDALSGFGEVATFRKRFSVSGNLMDEFLQFADSNGVVPGSGELGRSSAQIELQLKALIGRHIWQNKGYFPILNEQDETVRKAQNVLSESISNT